MIKAVFSHVGLTCENPDIIEAFYRDHFGFQRTKVFNPGPNQIIMLKSGDFWIELFKSEKENPLPAPTESGYPFSGWRHICFAVDDLNEKLKEMGEAVKLTSGPLNLDDLCAGMKACWIADPEGNIIELNEGYKE